MLLSNHFAMLKLLGEMLQSAVACGNELNMKHTYKWREMNGYEMWEQVPAKHKLQVPSKS
jgi:hypothetical protein